MEIFTNRVESAGGRLIPSGQKGSGVLMIRDEEIFTKLSIYPLLRNQKWN